MSPTAILASMAARTIIIFIPRVAADTISESAMLRSYHHDRDGGCHDDSARE